MLRSRGDARVIGAEACLVDGKRAPHQRLGLGEPVRGFQERRQIVEADGDVRVIGAEACLVDGKRAPHQRLGLPMLSTSYEIKRQLVQ